MPRSKRNQVLTLAKTERKGRELKRRLIEEVQACLDEYSHLYVLRVFNMRNVELKKIRVAMRDRARFFFGKNKVIAVGIGRKAETEYQAGISALAQRVKGDCGLLFSNDAPESICSFLKQSIVPEYARAGCVAPCDFLVRAGPLKDFSFAMEPTLRQLGLDTRLSKGIIELNQDCKVCSKGETLTSKQCRVLKLFGQQLATFEMQPECVWHDGQLTELAYPNDNYMDE